MSNVADSLESIRDRALGFLNANSEELAGLAIDAMHARKAAIMAQGDRFDRRVLAQMFLVAMLRGTTTRREIVAEDAAVFVQRSRELCDAFLAPPATKGE